MLTKLLKYEWKTTARVLLPIGGGVLGFTLITSLVNHLLNGYEAWPQVAVWLQDLLNVATVLAWIFVLGACVFLNVQRFYKLLGEQGYLMLSLPVPLWKHIAVKLISACVWTGIAVLYLILCGNILSGSLFSFSGAGEPFFAARTVTDVTALLFLAAFGVTAVAGAYLDFYLACAIGGQFGQQRLLASIISYFILGFLEQILATMVLILLMFGAVQMNALWVVGFVHSLNSFWMMVAVMSGILLLVVILDAIKWAVTQWLMTSRLNLV